MTEQERKEYIEFMNDAENICNCADCPENNEMDNSKYPCGQQNCWVACHCQE